MCVIDLTIDSSSDEEEPEQSMATTSKNIDQIKLDIDSVTQSSGAVKSNEQLNIEISAKDNSESESNTSDMMRFGLFDKDNFLLDDLVDGYNSSMEHEYRSNSQNHKNYFNKNNSSYENISFIMVD